MDAGLLDQLSDDDRRALLARMTRRRYRRGDTLFHEGDPGDTLHVIDKGRVAIRTTTSLGDVATLTVLGPPSMFGEQALVSGDARRTASAVALDDVETRMLHRGDFETLLAEHPRVERFVVQLLAAQVRRLTAELVEALYVSADRRVVRRLVDVAASTATGRRRRRSRSSRRTSHRWRDHTADGEPGPQAARGDRRRRASARARSVVSDHVALAKAAR